MDSLELMKQFLKAGNRIRRIDLGRLHPGITHGEFVLLERISSLAGQHGEIHGARISELVRCLETSPPAVSRMLRTLEQKKLIEREIDKRDRRSMCVCLTAEGENLRRKGHERLISFAKITVEAMGKDDMQKLIDLWNRLGDVLQAQLKQYGKGDGND